MAQALADREFSFCIQDVNKASTMGKFTEIGRASDRFVRGLAKLILGLVILTLGARLHFETPVREIAALAGVFLAAIGALQIAGFRLPKSR